MFTDVEDSTRLLHGLGDVYEELVSDLREFIGRTIEEGSGVVVDMVGDEVFSAFDDTDRGIETAVALQKGVAKARWPGDAEVRIRVGMHRGEVQLTKNGYIGLPVNKAARVCAAGHGGQIVVSDEIVSATTGDEISFRPLGHHQLAGLPGTHALHQVEAIGLETEFPGLRIRSE